MSGKVREEDVTRKAQLKDIAKFMKQVLPEHPVQIIETRERMTPHVKRQVVESLSNAAGEINPKKPKLEIDEEDDVEVSDFDYLAGPYLRP